jgi:hypothetical protein
MPEPKDRFHHARLKVHWSHRHIQNLNAVVTEHFRRDAPKLRVETASDTGNQAIKLDGTNRFPMDVPLLLGDALHNLRTSLDYVASAIVGHGDHRASFPMDENGTTFKNPKLLER